MLICVTGNLKLKRKRRVYIGVSHKCQASVVRVLMRMFVCVAAVLCDYSNFSAEATAAASNDGEDVSQRKRKIKLDTQ